jgi:pilus assembly protein CpaB
LVSVETSRRPDGGLVSGAGVADQMPIRTIATLAIAIFLGIVAVFLVRTYLLSSRQAAPGAVAATGVPVVVATEVIERGKPVEAKQLKVVNYPADGVPAGSFRTVAELAGAPADKRVALRSFAPNEPLLATRISGPGARLVLSATLGEGMRAVSLRSNDVAGVAGFVLPGDRVDILLTRSVGDGNQTVTQVLAENVRVLGVDQSDNDEASAPVVARAVTVEVTPQQAQVVALAQSVGSVSLSLRQINDQAPLGRRATTVRQLGFSGAPPAAGGVRPAIRPAGFAVHVTRGVETADYRVP